MPANILVYLNSYKDSNSPTNNPLQNVFKYTREVNGLAVSKATSNDLTLAPYESKTIFNGTRTLGQNNTTQYALAQVGASVNSYSLTWTGGLAPVFRTLRTTGADATTTVTITRSGYVSTFTSSGGTPFSLISGGVVVGDQVVIGSNFNLSNQGVFTVISVTATSFSIENQNGVAEGPITLGAGFVNQVRIFSSGPVQVGDTVNIFGGFSPASRGAYQITQVQDNLIKFYSSMPLPAETVITDNIVIYSSAKKFLYLETDQLVSVAINGVTESNLQPFNDPTYAGAGMLLKSSLVWSLAITNLSPNTANLYSATVE